MPKKTKEQLSYEKQEKEWQKERDARTLIEAEKIKADRQRVKDATSYIVKQKREAEETLATTRKLIKGK